MATISKCVLWPSKWIDFLTVWPITLSYTTVLLIFVDINNESLSKKTKCNVKLIQCKWSYTWNICK